MFQYYIPNIQCSLFSATTSSHVLLLLCPLFHTTGGEVCVCWGVPFDKSLSFTLIPLLSLCLLTVPLHFPSASIHPICFPIPFLPSFYTIALPPFFPIIIIFFNGWSLFCGAIFCLVVRPKEDEYSWLIHSASSTLETPPTLPCSGGNTW